MEAARLEISTMPQLLKTSILRLIKMVLECRQVLRGLVCNQIRISNLNSLHTSRPLMLQESVSGREVFPKSILQLNLVDLNSTDLKTEMV
jgi:hypothetical protein